MTNAIGDRYNGHNSGGCNDAMVIAHFMWAGAYNLPSLCVVHSYSFWDIDDA